MSFEDGDCFFSPAFYVSREDADFKKAAWDSFPDCRASLRFDEYNRTLLQRFQALIASTACMIYSEL